MYYSKRHDIYVNGGIRGRGKLDEVFALLSLAFVDGLKWTFILGGVLSTTLHFVTG